MSRQVIRLHSAAPAKPAEAAPCNGCGVCCAAEPCPVGVLVSGRRTGACRALLWNPGESRYRCGLAGAPQAVLPRLPGLLVPLVRRLALRWISAASGCDSTIVVEWPEELPGSTAVPSRRSPAALSCGTQSSTVSHHLAAVQSPPMPEAE